MPELSPSSSYRKLAYVYDHLMADAPYDLWMQFTLNGWRMTGTHPKRIAELGCGTGSLTRFLLETDAEVWAVDLSSDMLAVAKDKVAVSHPKGNIHFVQQDIRQLKLDADMDSVVSFCDTINYVTDENGVRQVFDRVFHSLVPGGNFLFDVHTPYKISEIFGDDSFHYQDVDVAYIWESSFDDEREMVCHDLTLFVNEANGLYRRFQETHHQRSYEIEQLASWLREVGFDVLSITGDFLSTAVKKDSERAFFVAQKPAKIDAG